MLKVFLALSAFLTAALGDGDPANVQATVSKYENELNADGSYNYLYASSNSLNVGETGIGGSHASGTFTYISPEGLPIKLTYTADESGYQPSGEHLPTAPPIPDYIIKSLAYIESHPFDKVSLHKN